MPDKVKLKKCRPLPAGGKIGIVATGSPVQPERLAAGLSALAALGFKIDIPLDPSKYYGLYDHGFTNGSPTDRAAALMQLIKDDSVDLILAARGGYGTLDILPLLDFGQIEKSRKAIVGYSDVTALLAAVYQRTGLSVVHGPTVSKEFAERAEIADSAEDTNWLITLMSDQTNNLGRLECTPIVSGTNRSPAVSGWALPGNLTMLQSMLGTPWDLSYDGAVLILEEVGEQPYRVHRALTQLALAGKFERLAGVVFGRFSKCDAKQGPSIDEVLLQCSADLMPGGLPVFRDLPFGHNGPNRAVPFGGRVKIENGAFFIEESPVLK